MKLKNELGFTLIEVMISMFIMATLTVLVSTSIRTAVQNKRKLELHMRSETELYDTLRVLKMDIEKAFNYQDVFFEMEKRATQELEDEKNKNKNKNNPVTVKAPPKKLTHFLGDNNSLNFTTLNHFRTQYNAQESNQIEVGFFVDSCQKRDGKGNTQCLWRRVQTPVDDRLEEGGSKVPLAENVTNFKLSYRSDKEDEDWSKEWRSDEKGRIDHRNKFPYIVKIELAIGDKNDKKIKAVSQSVVIRLQFPNNDPLITPPQPRSGNTTGAPGTTGANP